MSAPVATPVRPEHELDIAPSCVVTQRRAVRDFVELTKPRVVTMVLVTTLVGFYLGAWGTPDWWLLAATLLGTGLSAGGTLALNQYLERDADARMDRTCGRPLPSGRLQPLDALLFGAAVTAVGLLILTILVNPLSGLVTATTVLTYLGCYTPMKRTTPLCGIVGAVPGALPPVTGWVAAGGDLGLAAAVLFGILFFWQLPHTLAIARLYADDYARAGVRVLPVDDSRGTRSRRQIVSSTLVLVAVSLLPMGIGISGIAYSVTACALGLGLLGAVLAHANAPSTASARRVLMASLLYLPLLLAVLAFDKP